MDRLKGHTALFHEVTKSVGMDDSLQETPDMNDEEMINLSDDEDDNKLLETDNKNAPRRRSSMRGSLTSNAGAVFSDAAV